MKKICLILTVAIMIFAICACGKEPEEVVEVTENSFVCGAQDYFDFQIKVRAFKEENGTRIYSEWSNEAEGSAYTEDEIH